MCGEELQLLNATKTSEFVLKHQSVPSDYIRNIVGRITKIYYGSRVEGNHVCFMDLFTGEITQVL